MIHCARKTFLIGKIEKARDVSPRRLNENENSCDGDCVRPYSGGGCRPSRVVGADGKRKNIIPKVENRS